MATPRLSRFSLVRGFTIIELLIVLFITSIFSLGLYALVQAGMTVGVRSLALNNTGNVSRNSLDRAEQLIQIAYDTPVMLQRNGTPATDQSAAAAGLRFYRYGGGPYEVDIPNTGLSGTTTSLDIFARSGHSSIEGDNTRSPEGPTAPRPNDIFVINTTILMTGRANQIYAYVRNVTKTTSATRTSSTGRSIPGVIYTVELTQSLTDNNGMIPPGSVSKVTAILIRPTALIVVPNGDSRELRLYENFVETANLNLTQDHTVLTSQVAWPNDGTPNGTDTFGRPFTLRTIGTKAFVTTDLPIRNDRYDRFLRDPERNEFSTFTSLKSRVPVKCNPNDI